MATVSCPGEAAHSPYYGASYLYVDYGVSCESDRYKFYRGYALLMVFVYPLGIPTLFAVHLFKHRRKIIQVQQQREQGSDSNSALGKKQE